jgi:hypothetical protein
VMQLVVVLTLVDSLAGLGPRTSHASCTAPVLRSKSLTLIDLFIKAERVDVVWITYHERLD